MYRLGICPLQSGYSARRGNGVITSQPQRGPARRRVGFKNMPHMVSASWNLDETQFEYLVAFWEWHSLYPNNKFIVPLAIDTRASQEYQCLFDFESGFSSSVEGRFTQVSLVLEVVAKHRDPELDQTILEMGEVGLLGLYRNIEKIPNVWLPDAVGV